MNTIHIPINDNQWKDYLQEGQQIAGESIMEYCNRIAEFKASCEIKQGGSEFSSKCQEWLNLNQTTCKKLALIGENNKLVHSVHDLPISYSTLYELTKLSDDNIEDAVKSGEINPNMTRQDASKLRVKFNPKITKPAKAQPVIIEGEAEVIEDAAEEVIIEDEDAVTNIPTPSAKELFGDDAADTEIAITDASTNNQQPVKEPEPKPTTFNATVESRDKKITELIDEIDALQLQLDNEPADISNFSIKNIYNMYPPAHRKKLEARKQNNNLPNFSDTLFTQIESKIQASLNKLDRPTAQKVMKSLADIMNAMDIVSKSVLDELLPEYISQTDIKLAARQEELDKREAELIKDKVTIPNNILGRGYTHEEVKRLKSAIHPDTTSSPEKKTEAFQLLERELPSEANQRKSNKAQENA